MSVVFRNLFIACVVVVSLLTVCPCQGETVLTESNIEKYFFDGTQLTKNWEVRYLSAKPVDIRVTGKSADEAAALVDGDKGGVRPIVWNPGEKAEISLDLGKECLVSAVFAAIVGNAKWQMATSADGHSWTAIPTESILRTPDHVIAPSLARIARYVRMSATAVDKLSVTEVFVYGEARTRNLSVIGGIYPSVFPPVAGKEVRLRAVIRNFTSKPMDNVQVKFIPKEPRLMLKPFWVRLGDSGVKSIPPGCAAIAAINWTPEVTEPYKMVVQCGGQEKTVVIPVVNRNLYFGSFRSPEYTRQELCNLYTSIGDGTITLAPDYWLVKLHGGIGLSFTTGPLVTGNMGEQKFRESWSPVLSAPFRDGIAMDEWGDAYPEALSALASLQTANKGRMIVPWACSSESGYKMMDVILLEKYCNILGHNLYRSYLRNAIRTSREAGIADRTTIALGYFTDRKHSLPEDMERQIRYIRFHAPEMPGVASYGNTYRIVQDKIWDGFWYKYFIAPVVVLSGVRAEGFVATATVKNIGGMNAHRVKLATTSAKDNAVRTVEVPLLRAGEQASVKLTSDGSPTPAVRVLDGSYTVLEDKPLEVLPPKQVQGNPVQICWTNTERTLKPSYQIEFVNASGHTDLLLDGLSRRGYWDNEDDFYLKNIDTAGLTRGVYAVRMVDTTTGDVLATDRISITAPGGRFYAKSVNGVPWKGDPQRVEVKPGDKFEVAWDLTDQDITYPAIYVSPPGSDLRMPAPDRGYAYADVAGLAFLSVDPDGNPLLKGSWQWKTALSDEDMVNVGANGWLRDGWGAGASGDKINMSLNPGDWRLWIGTADDAAWALPKTPVIMVSVKP